MISKDTSSPPCRGENVSVAPDRPLLLITLGDVAGIGPEIVARAWPALVAFARPVVVGDPLWLRRGLEQAGRTAEVRVVTSPGEVEATADLIPCLHSTKQELSAVIPGRVSAAAGRAAYDFLCDAIDRTMRHEADAIVTCPLHKEGLHAAGVPHPGHTEILGERTGTKRFAMLLHGDGLTVAHVTLHVALRDVFAQLTRERVRERIDLLDAILPRLHGRRGRIAVAALNPHGSDGGLFGDEEERIIAPAVREARTAGVQVSGPLPADTLFVRASKGDFDGIVAMYHDEGHIAMKLRSGWRCVNVTAGLPIVRTSVAHGTAYDVAGRGVADESSLIEAARVAAKLACKSAPAPA
jgi:4-hydroxythreonine-4-phosphate dehydrogenase